MRAVYLHLKMLQPGSINKTVVSSIIGNITVNSLKTSKSIKPSSCQNFSITKYRIASHDIRTTNHMRMSAYWLAVNKANAGSHWLILWFTAAVCVLSRSAVLCGFPDATHTCYSAQTCDVHLVVQSRLDHVLSINEPFQSLDSKLDRVRAVAVVRSPHTNHSKE